MTLTNEEIDRIDAALGNDMDVDGLYHVFEQAKEANRWRDAVAAYFAALDAWNGPQAEGGGSGSAEGKLNRAEMVLRELAGLQSWTGTYR